MMAWYVGKQPIEKWEYLIKGWPPPRDATVWLDDLGFGGWELVVIINHNAIFKRRRK